MLIYESKKSYEKKVVTVGMCALNAEKIIADAIISINNQDFPKELMEFIFVDDGSTDNTLKLVLKCVKKMDVSVKIFSNEWKGLGPSRNIIFQESEGKYIVWIDADQIIPGNMINILVNFMNNNEKVGISKGIRGIINKSTSVATLEMMYHQTAQLLDLKQVKKPLGTGGSIYRKQALSEINGFDKTIKNVGEDIEAEYRILLKGWLLKRVISATYYEKCRSTWKELWIEYCWHGKGSRIINKKELQIHSELNNKFLPFLLIRDEMTRTLVAYQITKKKLAFLLPFHWLFKRIAWIYGYIQSEKVMY